MAKRNKSGLTDRQQKFCDEYLIDLNATQAAIRAGYSAKTAYSQGQRLLKNVEVAKYIDERRAVQTKRTEIEADWILTTLKELAERCMQHEPVLNNQGEETGEYRFDSSGANRALELLGKHKKLWTDKVEVSKPEHEIAVAELARLRKLKEKHGITADQP